MNDYSPSAASLHAAWEHADAELRSELEQLIPRACATGAALSSRIGAESQHCIDSPWSRRGRPPSRPAPHVAALYDAADIANDYHRAR